MIFENSLIIDRRKKKDSRDEQIKLKIIKKIQREFNLKKKIIKNIINNSKLIKIKII